MCDLDRPHKKVVKDLPVYVRKTFPDISEDALICRGCLHEKAKSCGFHQPNTSKGGRGSRIKQCASKGFTCARVTSADRKKLFDIPPTVDVALTFKFLEIPPYCLSQQVQFSAGAVLVFASAVLRPTGSLALSTVTT